MKTTKPLIKSSILSLSLLIIMTNTAISPALGEIKQNFSEAEPIFIKMILTIPSIVMIPFSLLSGKISLIIKKRRIIIIGLMIYTLGGILGGFSKSIFSLLFFRLIIGIGMGLIMPLATSLIADFYQGEERTKMMGLSNAVANLGGIFATLIGGYLALISWRYVFYIYIVALGVLLLTFFELPEPPIRMTSEKIFKTINKKVLLIALITLLINIAFYSVITNIDFFIENRNIGTSKDSGFAISSLTLAGFLSGLLLKKISSILKGLKISISIGIMSLGFIILSSSYNIGVVLISTFFIGFGLGILKPTLFLRVTEFTPKYSNAFSLSIVTSSVLLGKFLSPFFLDVISLLLHLKSIGDTFLIVGLSLGIGGIISLILRLLSIDILSPSYDNEV